MSNPKDFDAEVGRESGVSDVLSRYTTFINARPPLISLLYDIDLLPEQAFTFSDAVRIAAFCEVWKKGEDGTLPGNGKFSDPKIDVDALAKEIQGVDPSAYSSCARDLASALSPYVNALVSGASEKAKRSEAPTSYTSSDFINAAMGASA
jgi:hypothetical protein|nr:hypothetical protein [Neorhizobium tomejilense]